MSIQKKLSRGLFAAAVVAVLMTPACSQSPAADDLGAIEASLQLAPGLALASASYTIAGPGGFMRSRVLDVRNSTVLSVVIGDLPAGIGYTISIAATTVDGAVTCSGSATFDVVARVRTAVNIHIRCLEAPRNGSIGVTGTINVCPALDSLSVSPAEVTVGSSLALSAAAHDLDNRPALLTYQWTATGGTLSNAAAQSPTFTCTASGGVMVTVTVTDGDCSDSDTALLTCSPRETPLPAIKINEIESNGGTPGDWTELFNAGTTAVDLSGWVFKDNDDTRVYSIAPGTIIAAGGFFVLDEAAFGFGLGAADSARLYEPGGTTIVDSHSWTAHATTTYGRCPDGSGAFVTSLTVTKGAANNCGGGGTPDGGGGAGGGAGGAGGGAGGSGGAAGGAGGGAPDGGVAALPWPGGAEVVTVDETGQFPTNLSGLTYQPSAAAAPAVLWAVQNSPSVLFRLVSNGTSWVPSAADDWSAGKGLRYSDGTGNPDAEGVTKVESSSPFIYVSTERNNDASATSRLSILRFDTSAAGPVLTATHDWNLTADLPAVGANLGLEAITWVPDSYLVANAFVDERAGAPYDPAIYPNHAGGLFFVGIEANGLIHAYALDHVGGGFARVASIASGYAGMMSMEFDRETNYLWAGCDNSCGNKFSILQIATSGLSVGRFQPRRVFDRPAGLPDVNNEGIALAPESECVAGLKNIFWSDDNGTGGHALRRGTIPCGGFL